MSFIQFLGQKPADANRRATARHWACGPDFGTALWRANSVNAPRRATASAQRRCSRSIRARRSPESRKVFLSCWLLNWSNPGAFLCCLLDQTRARFYIFFYRIADAHLHDADFAFCRNFSFLNNLNSNLNKKNIVPLLLSHILRTNCLAILCMYLFPKI